MAAATGKSTLFIFLIISSLSLQCFLVPCSSASYQDVVVPAMFVFGSSVVDPGNNDYLNTAAKADYYPYGLDFRCGPTGRFTNGPTIADVVSKTFLNFPRYLPAFNNPKTKGKLILNGVNYGSAGSGILNATGTFYGEIVPFTTQVTNFGNTTLADLQTQTNNSLQLSKYLSSSFFYLAIGANDYLLNYFQGNTSKVYTVQNFTAMLIDKYAEQITRLYRWGARKFVLQDLPPYGCSPLVMKTVNVTSCFDPVNQAYELFNRELQIAMINWKSTFVGTKFVFLNIYTLMLDIINFPKNYGVEVVNKPCCATTLLGSCIQDGIVCEKIDAYVFFDGLHTTSAVNEIFGKTAFKSMNKTLLFPYNLKKLALTP